MKKRKMVVVLTSFAVAASLCITSLASVSTPATAEPATSSTAGRENGKKENVVEELSQDVELDDGVNIEIPMDLSFSIDPINLMEKGQILSKEYTFKNNSDRDVRITFSEIHYTFSNEQDFRSLKSLDELNPYSTTKDIFLYLENVSPKVKLEASDSQELKEPAKDFDPNVEEETEGNGEEVEVVSYHQMEEQKIVITDEIQNNACSFILSGNKNSSTNKITFRFNGAVTEFPEEPWENSDIKIHVTYDCTFEVKEEAVLESLAAIEETIETVEGTAAESRSPEEGKEDLKESESMEGTAASPEENDEELKETSESSKEDSTQSGENETEKESQGSSGSQSSEDKGDVGTKEEGQDSSQKEEASDKKNDGNYSGNESAGNSSSEKNASSENSSGKSDSSSSNNTSEKSDNSEESGKSERTDSGTANAM